jgi:hypothetical protein
MVLTRAYSSLEPAVPLTQVNYLPFVNRTRYSSHHQSDYGHMLLPKKEQNNKRFRRRHPSWAESTEIGNLEMQNLKKLVAPSINY